MGVTYVAVTSGPQLARGASTDALDEQYSRAIIELLRNLVDPVPGSGVVRGVWYYNGITYAFRDDELGLECKMYKSTATGWIEVVTGVTLSPGGRYEFINYNFLGHDGARKMYGCDGVNKGFQFDGTIFTQITTGMVLDTPEHVFAHKKHLFFSFSGGSAQHSSIGDPLTWTPITGAAELAMGDNITGFVGAPGNILTIMSKNSTNILRGTSSADWALEPYSDEAGAVEWTIQRFNYPIYLDDRGVTSLDAVQAFGDFKAKMISQKIQRVLRNLKGSVVSSIRIKEKDQYRLFFDDSTSLTFAFNDQKLIGITPSNLGIVARCTASVDDVNGEELLLFGSDSGYVYRLDSGTSFDGQEVDAFIRPMFNHFGSPENDKRFFKTVLEIDADQSADLTFLPEFGYGDPDLPESIIGNVSVSGGGGIWDDSSAVWESFYFDAQIVSTAFGYTEGVGQNFSLFIRSIGTYDKPHTIQGAIIHFSVKGVKR